MTGFLGRAGLRRLKQVGIFDGLAGLYGLGYRRLELSSAAADEVGLDLVAFRVQCSALGLGLFVLDTPQRSGQHSISSGSGALSRDVSELLWLASLNEGDNVEGYLARRDLLAGSSSLCPPDLVGVVRFRFADDYSPPNGD